MTTYNEPINTSISAPTLDIETIRPIIDEQFNASYESGYWSRRLASDHHDVASYHSFRKKESKAKRRYRKSGEFKRSAKWYGYDDRYFDYEAYVYEYGDNTHQPASKSRVFCHDCGRTKLLFDTQEQADRFLRFNAEEIATVNGYAPVRAYYCSFCCGWHVTSLDESLWHEGKTQAERRLEAIMTIKENNRAHAVAGKIKKTAAEQEAERQAQQEEAARMNEMLEQVRLAFEVQMRQFEIALQAKDLEQCKSIHHMLADTFASINIDRRVINRIKKRIEAARESIDQLAAALQREEEKRRSLIWSIRQAFRQQLDRFNHLLALGKTGECYEIVDVLTSALASFPCSMSIVKELHKKLDLMMTRLDLVAGAQSA